MEEVGSAVNVGSRDSSTINRCVDRVTWRTKSAKLEIKLMVYIM